MRMRVRASRAPNGSSSSSSSGSRTSARASAARCASPPERVLGQSPLVAVEADLGQRGPAPARGVAAAGRPSTTLSSTVAHGSRRASWNTTDRRRRARGSRPSTPRSRPASARRSVLLPEPLRPSRATNSPGRRSRSRPSSTSRSPKRPRGRRGPTTARPSASTATAARGDATVASPARLPAQQPPLEGADERRRREPEHGVDDQADDDHVGLEEGLGPDHQVADAAAWR